MGEVSIELTVSSDINTWLEEQTADRELSTAAYIEELLAAARESGAESVISDDKVAQEAVDDGYADRFGTIEAEIEALNERQTDTVEGLSKLKQRLATLEAKIE
jgi:septal ring factor EnvC (AmiA/AmiB activator)